MAQGGLCSNVVCFCIIRKSDADKHRGKMAIWKQDKEWGDMAASHES